jgi:hypothetical protein
MREFDDTFEATSSKNKKTTLAHSASAVFKKKKKNYSCALGFRIASVHQNQYICQ